MWDFNLLAATRSIEASMPFLFYRLMVYLGVGLAYIFSTLAGAGTAIAFASFSANPAALGNLGAIIGFAGCGFALYRFRASLFFNVKAGHLALLADRAHGEKIPQGNAQIAYAQETARRVFGSSATFHEAVEAIGEVMIDLSKKYSPFPPFIEGAATYKYLAHAGGRLAATCDLAILALCFYQEFGNLWKSVQTGLVLQAKHFRWLLKNRLYLLLFEYLGLFAGFALILFPVNSAAAMLPLAVGAWPLVFAFVLAWSLKAAFFQPIAAAAMAQLYFNLTEKEPSEGEPQAEDLPIHSEAFSKIRERASR